MSEEQVQHPVLAIVDKHDARTVIWRVETTPGFEPLSGAWITESTADVENLVSGAVVIPVGEHDDEVRAIEGAGPFTSIESITAELKKAGVALTKELEEQPQYTGEPSAETAWANAIKVTELVEAWRAFETRRRQRDGDELRALPTPPLE
ncbi:hypothetical protein [Corynebacterium lubricantis]|uniref:hypothetical protein n=1 Tax=Corynebacterium lubricantis TaxID=541095 RepID=UPI000379DC97|nr:hypothetical protein [Corynebacterium lubricantis]